MNIGYGFDSLINAEDLFRASLKKSEEILSSKEVELENLQYEVAIIKENSARLVREYTDALQYMDFHSIWLDYKEDHKFKNKDNKVRLSIIEDYFFSRDTKRKLLEIICFGYNEQAYEFKYKVGDKIFIILIPIFKTATVDNYNQLFYEIQNQDDEHCYSVVARTRFLDEMKEEVAKYLKGGVLNGEK